MKQYIKPQIYCQYFNTQPIMSASRQADITTPKGGFYECSNSGCRPNSYVWADVSDSRNITETVTGTRTETLPDWLGGGTIEVPYSETIKLWQYIGCYEYKSNGSGVTCEDFHGTTICEGTQWDLFINADGDYYVRSCPDGVH
ncbi:MAG: hypothetical protein IJ456_10930 [Bacteroides sp.]|nr:hypothetical protein [Bacteroides sp.]